MSIMNHRATSTGCQNIGPWSGKHLRIKATRGTSGSGWRKLKRTPNTQTMFRVGRMIVICTAGSDCPLGQSPPPKLKAIRSTRNPKRTLRQCHFPSIATPPKHVKNSSVQDPRLNLMKLVRRLPVESAVNSKRSMLTSVDNRPCQVSSTLFRRRKSRTVKVSVSCRLQLCQRVRRRCYASSFHDLRKLINQICFRIGCVILRASGKRAQASTPAPVHTSPSIPFFRLKTLIIITIDMTLDI